MAVQIKEKETAGQKRRVWILPVAAIGLVWISVIALYVFGRSSPMNKLLASNAAVMTGDSSYTVPAASAAHGTDHAIAFTDPGVESRVRLYLNRPDGEIFCSDVWELRYIDIRADRVIFLEKPSSGDSFTVNGSYGAENQIVTDTTLPPICSLEDFQWFDSLQVLQINMNRISGVWEPLTQLSGPEKCENLTVMRLYNISPDDFDAVGNMRGLKMLSLNCYGSISLDARALEELKELEYLSLTNIRVENAAPLTELEALHSVRLYNCESSANAEENWGNIFPVAKELSVR